MMSLEVYNLHPNIFWIGNKRACKVTGKGFGSFEEKDSECANTCLNGACVKDLDITMFLLVLKLDFRDAAYPEIIKPASIDWIQK